MEVDSCPFVQISLFLWPLSHLISLFQLPFRVCVSFLCFFNFCSAISSIVLDYHLHFHVFNFDMLAIFFHCSTIVFKTFLHQLPYQGIVKLCCSLNWSLSYHFQHYPLGKGEVQVTTTKKGWVAVDLNSLRCKVLSSRLFLDIWKREIMDKTG